MTELEFVRSENTSYDTDFVNPITFSHDIFGDLGGFIEFFSVINSSGHSDWQGHADIGLTYGLNKNTQLDFGCNIGVTKSAPDFNPFIGFSWRF